MLAKELEGAVSQVAGAAKQGRVLVPDHVPTPARKVRSLELKQFICGVLAGAVSGALTSPLESVRTRVLARKGADSTAQLFNKAAQDEALRKAIMSTSLKMPIAMGALRRSVQFYVYETVKKAAQQSTGQNPKILPLPSAVPISSLAGAAGAFASTLVSYPMSMAGDHIALQPGKYSGLQAAMLDISRRHGVKELFRGVVPKLLSMVPAGALSFYTFDTIKQELEKGNRRKMTPIHNLSVGAIAGLVSTLATYPLEVACREINMSLLPRTATTTGGHLKYNNVAQAVWGIARAEGVAGLYRGITASLLEIVPQTAVGFMVYEGAKRLLVAQNQERMDEAKGD